MRWTAAAPDASATPVKQRDGHLVARARRDDFLLRLVEVPARSQAADVLGGVGVAEHYFLSSTCPCAIPVVAEEFIEHGAGVAEIARSLEQRHDATGGGNTRFLLQKLHREDVRGCS